MSFFRSLSASLLSAAASFSLVTASGCGTNAVGVDACRDIEQARCRAAKPCGIVDDVAACERYSRGQCLHGLAAQPPAAAVVSACVKAIEAAGQCAEVDAETALADCEQDAIPAARGDLATACDVVRHPELSDECVFLNDVPPEDGGGGQGAGGGASDDEPADEDGGAANE